MSPPRPKRDPTRGLAGLRTPPPSFRARRPASERASRAAASSSRKSDTRCELLLRSALWRKGLRFRTSAVDLPGRPDVIFRRLRVVVFCDGDFWHGRSWAARKRKLATGHNSAYWIAKIARNIERDRAVKRALEQDGWIVLRFWESDILMDADPIARQVSGILKERKRTADAPLTRWRSLGVRYAK